MTFRAMTRTVGAALLAALLAACGPPSNGAGPDAAYRGDYDPIEPVNRKVFWFNDKMDVYVLEPVATGWDKVAPDPVQNSVSNFFHNLRFPIVFANDVLQAKPKAAVIDFTRFAFNTVYGLGGFFDIASGWGLPRHSEDFGQTLGVWGVPPGPYLVWPVLGPSNPRDTVGILADSLASIASYFINGYILIGARAVEVVNTRSLLLDEVQQVKEASFDYYTFVRSAYFQHRAALVEDRADTTGPTDDSLYELELENKE